MTARIRVINANTTVAMTQLIAEGAATAAVPDVVIDAVTSPFGPPSIEGHRDEALAVPGVLAAVEEGERLGADAHIIACFGDPGLSAAREIAEAPVIGVAEAAMRTASFLAPTFSVVTTVARVVPQIEELAWRYGAERACAGVHATGLAVLDLKGDPRAAEVVRAACRLALEVDRSEAVVLGCAGMTDLADSLCAELGVPVIDGVAAAVGTATGLVRGAGLPPTRDGSTRPERKPLIGDIECIWMLAAPHPVA